MREVTKVSFSHIPNRTEWTLAEAFVLTQHVGLGQILLSIVLNKGFFPPIDGKILFGNGGFQPNVIFMNSRSEWMGNGNLNWLWF